MSKIINICVVGTNFISDWFADAAKKTSGVALYAVYSRSVETGSAFAKKHGIEKVYTNYLDALKDENISAVYIASPTICHSEQACLAMEYGKHVLCEKMIAADLDGFLKMKSASEKYGRVLLEAMRPAFDPAYNLVRASLDKIGRIRRASLEFCQYSSRYDKFKCGIATNAFDPKMKNSALADIGIYPLFVAVSLFGEPAELTCRSVCLSNGFEGSGQIMMDYSDKIVSVVYSKISDGFSESVIEGEHGSIFINKLTAPTRLTLKLRGEKEEILDYSAAENNMIYELAAFRDMINGVISHRENLQISHSVMHCVDKAYKSSGIFSE